MKALKSVNFRKSSFSGHYNCVGVARSGDKILLTNTKNQNIIVEFTVEEWDAFTKGVKIGEFDNMNE